MTIAQNIRLDNLEKATNAWGKVPEWVTALAEACNQETQSAVAKRVGYSASVISQVLSNTYHKGDIARFELAVRGALMAATVPCPVMGDLPRNDCLTWQRKPFAATNSHRVRMYQACRTGCPHSRIAGQDGDK